MKKYRIIVESKAKNLDWRVYNLRLEIKEDSAILEEVEKIDGVIPRPKGKSGSFTFIFGNPNTKQFHFCVRKASAFDWDEIEPGVLSAIAIIHYGCEVKDLEVQYREIDDDGDVAETPNPEPVPA